jgi:hypothetical protein
MKDQEEYFSNIISTYDSAVLQSLTTAPKGSTKSLLISGMPRSGTTLIEQIVSSHSEVSSTGESNIFRGAILSTAARMAAKKNPLSLLKDSNLEPLAKMVIAETQRKANVFVDEGQLFTDKTLGNFENFGLILSLFPETKALCIDRHPLDICLSNFQIFYTSGKQFSYNMEMIALRYKLYIKLIEYWQKRFPKQILLVRYEDVVDNQEEASKKIINFCGLDWEEHCLNFYETKNSVRTSSFGQVRQKIYGSSIGRWKKYASHLRPAANILGINIDELSGLS